MMVFIFFIIWKFIDFIISFLSPYIIQTAAFFPYRDLIESYRLPGFLTSFANFDGAHYVSIAASGYHQYEQAFFPLYPLTIKFLSPVFANNHLLTGLIISNAAFFIGLFVFKKYLNLINPKIKVQMSNQIQNPKFKPNIFFILDFRLWALIFLLFFPTSFFFGALYTEGLFFLFTVLTFYFLKKEKYFLAGLFSFFASLTRLVGIFLIIPFIVQLLHCYIVKKSKSNRTIEQSNNLAKLIISLLFPLIGLGLYSIYLYITTSDPLYFFHAQSNFNLNRSTEIILFPQVIYRYFKIFITAQHNFQYFISLFEFAVFGFVLFILALDLRGILLHVIPGLTRNPEKTRSRIVVRDDKYIDRLGLNLFSFANLLLPTFTGTFLSIPRFTLISLSVFIFLGEIENKWIKLSIVIIFILFHLIFFSFFVRGYFVS